jgi:hypothetical protein
MNAKAMARTYAEPLKEFKGQIMKKCGAHFLRGPFIISTFTAINTSLFRILLAENSRKIK